MRIPTNEDVFRFLRDYLFAVVGVVVLAAFLLRFIQHSLSPQTVPSLPSSTDEVCNLDGVKVGDGFLYQNDKYLIDEMYNYDSIGRMSIHLIKATQ